MDIPGSDSCPAQQAAPTWPSTDDDWERHYNTIRQLWLDEDRTLKDVMDLMKVRHGFVATPKQYKTKLDKWNLGKNVKTDEMKAIVKIQARRNPKPTEFMVRDRVVPQQKIDRFLHRTFGSANLSPSNFSPLSSTPLNVWYFTPRDDMGDTIMADRPRGPVSDPGDDQACQPGGGPHSFKRLPSDVSMMSASPRVGGLSLGLERCHQPFQPPRKPQPAPPVQWGNASDPSRNASPPMDIPIKQEPRADGNGGIGGSGGGRWTSPATYRLVDRKPAVAFPGLGAAHHSSSPPGTGFSWRALVEEMEAPKTW